MANSDEWKERELGALWKRETSSGDVLLSIRITIDGKEHDIVGFKNKFRKEDKHPHFRLYKSEPRGGGGGSQQETQTQDEQDDIPF